MPLACRTFPGHDEAAVVVRGYAYLPVTDAALFGMKRSDGLRYAPRLVWLALAPTSREARMILAAPPGAYSIQDERLT